VSLRKPEGKCRGRTRPSARPGLGPLFDATWPLLLAAALVAAHRALLQGRALVLPEGDLVVVLERWAGTLTGRRASQPRPAPAATPEPEADDLPAALAPLRRWLLDLERRQRRMPAVGLALLTLGGVLYLLSRWAAGMG
jgi:hypothetical protein